LGLAESVFALVLSEFQVEIMSKGEYKHNLPYFLWFFMNSNQNPSESNQDLMKRAKQAI
jgi:hypothetical protein